MRLFVDRFVSWLSQPKVYSGRQQFGAWAKLQHACLELRQGVKLWRQKFYGFAIPLFFLKTFFCFFHFLEVCLLSILVCLCVFLHFQTEVQEICSVDVLVPFVAFQLPAFEVQAQYTDRNCIRAHLIQLFDGRTCLQVVAPKIVRSSATKWKQEWLVTSLSFRSYMGNGQESVSTFCWWKVEMVEMMSNMSNISNATDMEESCRKSKQF